MLYRKIASYIEDHLRSDSDMMLVIEGARQIGKSYIIREADTIAVHAISNPRYPLKESLLKNLLKLYMNDVGMLTGQLYHRLG